MKRVLIALMLALFVGGALGCKGKEKEAEKKDGDKAGTEKTEEKKTE